MLFFFVLASFVFVSNSSANRLWWCSGIVFLVPGLSRAFALQTCLFLCAICVCMEPPRLPVALIRAGTERSWLGRFSIVFEVWFCGLYEGISLSSAFSKPIPLHVSLFFNHCMIPLSFSLSATSSLCLSPGQVY